MIPDFLEDGLGFNVYRTGLLFRRELIRALSDYKITPEQWQVMITLWHTGKPLNQSEIVQMLMKDKHTVSRIIKRLERDGWIKKKTDQKDGRITMIQPTKKGMSFKDEVQNKLKSHFNVILKDFPGEEINSLLKSLKKLRKLLGD